VIQKIVQGVPPARKHLETYMEPSSGPNTAIKSRPEEARRPKPESGESSIVVLCRSHVNPDVQGR
jgi:hypothetical protein